ncbi:hypothetical protein ALC62_07850 [Cyphomyrmex costatus]|uniref:Uncharacterized protein n=1 Tax=Cyphomyrmex costatus TaxID=456900 RepID=A0A195CKI1_9HYME|nr:hypothetical protein ALC62_07850 [Cyphomyrmex costatus]
MSETGHLPTDVESSDRDPGAVTLKPGPYPPSPLLGLPGSPFFEYKKHCAFQERRERERERDRERGPVKGNKARKGTSRRERTRRKECVERTRERRLEYDGATSAGCNNLEHLPSGSRVLSHPGEQGGGIRRRPGRSLPS